jgi:hypothetical protein
MQSSSRDRVTLSGSRSGRYVVVEEQPDGTLVLTPDRQPTGTRERPPERPLGATAGLLAALKPRSRDQRTVPELLADWDVMLDPGEAVAEFLMVNVDGRYGYVAITSHRLIFVPVSSGATREERPLSTLHGVDLVGHGRRGSLRLSWDDGLMLIRADARDALSRLERSLRAV